MPLEVGYYNVVQDFSTFVVGDETDKMVTLSQGALVQVFKK
jgi:hypothetical protein